MSFEKKISHAAISHAEFKHYARIGKLAFAYYGVITDEEWAEFPEIIDLLFPVSEGEKIQVRGIPFIVTGAKREVAYTGDDFLMRTRSVRVSTVLRRIAPLRPHHPRRPYRV